MFMSRKKGPGYPQESSKLSRLFFFNSDPRVVVSVALRLKGEKDNWAFAFGGVADYASAFGNFSRVWRVEEQLRDPYRSADMVNASHVEEVVIFFDPWDHKILSYQHRFYRHLDKLVRLIKSYKELRVYLEELGAIREPELKEDSLDVEFVSLVQQRRGRVDLMFYLGDFPPSAYLPPSSVLGFIEQFLRESPGKSIYLLGASAYHQMVKENFDVPEVVNLIGATSPIQNFIFAKEASFVLTVDSSVSVFLSALLEKNGKGSGAVVYASFHEDVCCPSGINLHKIKISLPCSGCSQKVCPMGVPSRCMGMVDSHFLYRIFARGEKNRA